MKFTEQILQNKLWEIYQHCNNSFCTYQVTKEELMSLTPRVRALTKETLNGLVRNGFMVQNGSCCQAIPFSLDFTASGIELVNRMAAIRNANGGSWGIPII